MSRNALIVGINQYDSRCLNNLRLPANDAEAIAAILEQYGDFRITRLPETINNDNRLEIGDSKITVSDLKTALVQLFKADSQQMPDTALFYFAGHGLKVSQGIDEGFYAVLIVILVKVLTVYP
jgi:uncharacterized caspase-like protein